MSRVSSRTSRAGIDRAGVADVHMTDVRLTVPAANRSGVFTSAHRLRLPRGWTAEVWALVKAARFEMWTPEHDLLASSPTGGTVTLLSPRAGHPAAPPSAADDHYRSR